ncbi:Hypothetical protein CINCED_3A023482 [Cinara cedri]|nr:Hypothetical protein CINCED_3A023482 [Cinara cedri]
MNTTRKEEKPLNPRAKANIVEIITHSWIIQLIKKGLEKDLGLNDLYAILDEDSSALLGNKLEKIWEDELIGLKKKNLKASFLRTLFRMFGRTFIVVGLIFTIMEICISIGVTTIVGRIVNHFETKKLEEQSPSGIYLAVALITALLVRTIMYSCCYLMFAHLAMKIRIATCNLIYNKALRIKINSSYKTSTGKIVNLMVTDVNRFEQTIVYVSFMWIGPLETIIITYFLWQEVGVSSLLGVGTLIVFIPLQLWLGVKTSDIRFKTSELTDKRMQLMKEIISGLQVIKMYTWEQFFRNLVTYVRRKEINSIKKSLYIKGILSSFFLYNTRIALFVNLFVYVSLGNYITASKVFVIMSYYNFLRMTMTIAFPPGIGKISELLASIKRIEEFLLSDEKDEQSISAENAITNGYENLNYDNCYSDTCDSAIPVTVRNDIISSSGNGEIIITNVSARWTDNNSLKNINLVVKPGRLYAIIGPVGAGKSSLLQSILRELPLSEGSVSVSGVVSYASQEPWLFGGSIQQNILFGSPMDEERYKQVIQVCALKTDFKQFPYGDRTIVGDRGESLSGGQKARVNLARAVYKQADIYLLDDPLSAVDTGVGQHLFDDCIKDFLNGKTCILITHQIQYLTNVDHIVLMESAKILAEGSYDELQTSGLFFTEFLGSPSAGAAEAETADADALLFSPVDGLKIEEPMMNGDDNSLEKTHKRLAVPISSDVTSTVSPIVNSETDDVEKPGPTVKDEACSTGTVALNVYVSYIFSGGYYSKVLALLLVCVLTQVFASGADIWIRVWLNLEEQIYRKDKHNYDVLTSISSDSSNSTSSTANSFADQLLSLFVMSRSNCIVVFATLTFLIIVSTFFESALLISVCTTASMNLHKRIFNSITHATMRFLNTTPSGQILKRFSKDIEIIDEVLPSVLIEIIQIGLTVIGILIVVGIVTPYLIPITLLMMIFFFKMRTIYMTTTRNVKRLEEIAQSPMLTHVNSSIQGLTTIRAFKVQKILCQEFASHQDLHSSASYLFMTLSRALGFWIDFSCLIYISMVTFYFIVFVNDSYGGNVGLAITQVVGLAGIIQWLVKISTELENQMISVERVLEYTVIEQESVHKSTQDIKPPKEWPNEGKIIFKHFYLRYDLDTPHVLKDLNIVIEPTEKVGIVGRTGAGKSSLIQALFRLAFNEGSIVIDDVEIHDLGLHDYRSRISIIPQEPILFSGTIRTNLDPYNEYNDHELWNALYEVNLKNIVDNLPKKLNWIMSEGGCNFSVGQKQLMCLARAILRKNKIIVLDEATANVDPQTDALIQETIRNIFRTCTVLTIAHRLNTIMNYDKILVMNDGTVVEFDRPFNLLKNTDGYFYKMVERTGRNTADLLHDIVKANECHNNEVQQTKTAESPKTTHIEHTS